MSWEGENSDPTADTRQKKEGSKNSKSRRRKDKRNRVELGRGPAGGQPISLGKEGASERKKQPDCRSLTWKAGKRKRKPVRRRGQSAPIFSLVKNEKKGDLTRNGPRSFASKRKKGRPSL